VVCSPPGERCGQAVFKARRVGRGGLGAGYNLHGWGLHEVKLSVDDVAVYLESVKAMVEEASRSLLAS